MNTIRAAILVALAVSGVTCNDLRVGSSNGRIVFNETIQASPAIWRQSQQITINVTDQEVINCVVVTDQRPDKDGEAQIVEGGEGHQNVTIELKSPTVFRGFDFHVVVYAEQGTVRPLSPAVMTKDIDLNSSAKPESNANVGTVTPKVTEKQVGHESPIPPTLIGDVPRKSINSEQPDSIVKFVTEKSVDNVKQSTTEVNTEVTTENNLKDNVHSSTVTAPKVELTTEDNKAHRKVQGFKDTVPLKDFNVKSDLTTNIVPNEQATSTSVPLKDFDVKTGTAAVDITSTTEKTHEKMVQQNFESISKELGQKIVFGIKH